MDHSNSGARPRIPAPDDRGGAPIDYGVLGDAIGYQLRLAEQTMAQHFARRFRDTEVTPARFTALELIDRNPGIRPAQLAAAMFVETSNLATVLRLLEAAGLVRARPGSDRRSKSLWLSEDGRRAIRDLRRRQAAMDRDLTRHLARGERAVLSRLLGKLVGVVDGAGARAGVGPRPARTRAEALSPRAGRARR